MQEVILLLGVIISGIIIKIKDKYEI